jgi:hypothetical protein
MIQLAMPVYKAIWKLKLPHIWLFLKDVILTKDNLVSAVGEVMRVVTFATTKKLFSIFFFQLHVAHFVWRVFKLLLVCPPRNPVDFLFLDFNK